MVFFSLFSQWRQGCSNGRLDKARPLSTTAVFTLCLVHLATMANRSMFAAIVPLIGRQYRVSDTALGILLGPAFAVTYGMAAIAFGWRSDRRPPHGLMIGGLALLAIASTIIAVGDRFGLFFLAQVLIGLGQAAVVPAAMLLIIRAGSDTRAGPPPLSLFTGASALGRSIGFIMAGIILAATASLKPATGIDGWRMLPLATLLSMMGLLMALPRLMPRDHVIMTPVEPDDDARLTAALIPLFIASCAPILIGQSLAAWIPSLLVRMRGYTPAGAASLLGFVLLVMGFAGQVVGGFATQRIGWIARRPLVANAACLIAAQPLLAAATHTEWSIVLIPSLAGVIGLTGIAAFVALQAVQAATPAARRGATTGLFLALVTLVGTGGGPLLTGVLSDATLTPGDGQGLALALVIVGCGSAGFNALLALGAMIGSVRGTAAV